MLHDLLRNRHAATFPHCQTGGIRVSIVQSVELSSAPGGKSLGRFAFGSCNAQQGCHQKPSLGVRGQKPAVGVAMPDSNPNGQLAEGMCMTHTPLPAVPTEEATIHDDAITLYCSLIPLRPIMTAGPED